MPLDLVWQLAHWCRESISDQKACGRLKSTQQLLSCFFVLEIVSTQAVSGLQDVCSKPKAKVAVLLVYYDFRSYTV